MARGVSTEQGDTFQFLVALPKERAQQLNALAEEEGVSRVSLVRSAIEILLTERGAEKLSVELSDELRVNLRALQDAMYGASVQPMIADALETLIQTTLDENPGIRKRFDKVRKKLVSNGEGGSGKVIEFSRTRMS